ncbi:YeeE/YedE family protein [Morganella morganii]|uniref:YeeE/YedE family protein n=1 Tax=Morganella morganii TaxID=582 RepID=UPI00050953B5|nr:YeeE/YedE thiosulfate transporter family protein [Morganella morganii]EKU4003152.1 YeeE/YedE family protein [Morganella morganii]MBT0406492.1 YeeE/YedE family protein [Morganella morganii subsp. morganii]MBT0424290.1 YeeE/YedE family protein [Morganella morganii subsp. morganii]MBT0471880.1 YeeE/YedE family protein [Morganella morganii subsp. morganii]QWM01586.1 YeeE/YedE family protein [Morganella morganii subsp. morganii]
MIIDNAAFTPVSAALGGLMIGIAVAVLLLFNGRIAGISGIFANMFTKQSGWRIAFIAGLAGAPWVYRLFAGQPDVVIAADYPLLIAAGLLVGFGTRLGNGCTSGHGICGMARLSKRSFAAVAVFMVSAFLTVWLMK